MFFYTPETKITRSKRKQKQLRALRTPSYVSNTNNKLRMEEC